MLFQKSWNDIAVYCSLLILTTHTRAAPGVQLNIANLATLNVSSTSIYNNNDYKKENAIDGKVEDNIDSCGCCFVSKQEKAPVFTAHFDGHYHVEQITLIGRQTNVDVSQDLSDVTVHLDNTPVPVKWDAPSNTATVSPHPFSVQTITISRLKTSGTWYLVICELKVLTSGTNIARHASLIASPSLIYLQHNYDKDNAVDGEVGSDANWCNCCYSSESTQTPYFQANFKRPYDIRQIVLEGRKDIAPDNSKLSGVTVGVDSNNKVVNTNLSLNRATVIPSSPLQNITIQRPTTKTTEWFLMICELQVLMAKCATGFYGDTCLTSCPENCADERECEILSGNCSNGCVPGFYGGVCNIPCLERTYGVNCSHTCHCKDDMPCNTTNGHCQYGCASGWTGSNCSQECAGGTFGEDCLNVCRCMNNTACDRFSGNCSNGCDYGWKGDNCSTDVNLLSRIKDTVTTSMSTAWGKTNSSLAIDGRYYYTDFNSCQCCSVADKITEPSYWLIDLGEQYLIQNIYVVGRKEVPNQSQNLTIFISNYTLTESKGTLLESQSGPVYIYNFSPPNVLQFLSITRTTASVMTICEVTFLEGECSHGTFGDKCSRTCHCRDKQQCNKVTGTCTTPGCLPGWIGGACDEACPNGTFGDNCSVKCHCLNGTHCDNVNGECDNRLCAAGWQMTNCSQVCNHGHFGFNCSTTCHCLSDAECNHVYGICANGLCQPGWHADNCSKACDDRLFGMNCSTVCHCFNNTSCEKEHGKCLVGMCEAGWQTDTCSEECDDGQFGLNCNSTCHCLNGSSCWKNNGTCIDDLCDYGWRGETCSEECGHRRFGLYCSSTCHCQGNTSCNHTHGVCEVNSCDLGYRLPSCDKECLHGTYGQNCVSTCKCLNNSRCHKEHGTCDIGLCEPGWKTDSCSLECDSGAFGENCSQKCYCFNSTECDNVNGTCNIGQCDPGYEGHACSQPLEASSDEDSGTGSGAAVGGGIAAAVVVIAVALALVIFMRRRRKHNTDKEQTPMDHDDTRSFENLEVPETASKVALADEGKHQINNAFEGDNHEYYSFSPRDSAITLPKLWNYIRRHQEDENKLFDEEFVTLPHGLVHSYSDSQKPENKKKNRYREMYAYDHSRVILEVTGPGETDYINACHIHGYGHPKKFIASQGPMDVMLNDFWRMVWQQKVRQIVMLTNPIEAGSYQLNHRVVRLLKSPFPTGIRILLTRHRPDAMFPTQRLVKVKCIQYWPEDGEERAYGGVEVKLVRSETLLDYIKRDFIISMDGSERTLTQFHFKSWPDKDVPDSTWCLVNFWRAVNRDQGQNQDTPILVHCSAGIGRTGTYIAMDFIVNQMKEEGDIRPLQAVQTLRKQRLNMVQTKQQYAFLHEAVADALGIGTHFVFSSQFPDLYHYLSEREPGATQTRFAAQFDMVLEILMESGEPQPPADAEVEYANTSSGTEIDAYRPKVRKRSSKHIQEMGAMYLPSFSGANTFLVGKSPTENSMVEFWSLVQEENVKTVISLCESSAKNYKAVCSLGSDTSSLSGSFQVDMIQECKQKVFTERTFVFNDVGKDDVEDRTTVKVFDYTAWKAGYNTPGDALSVLDFVEAVNKWQFHISESQPLLVHCGNGTRRSGLMCLVLSELNRIKREDGQINVLDSFIRLKQRNNDVIDNADQYRFCHDVILSHLQQQQMDTQNIYANA